MSNARLIVILLCKQVAQGFKYLNTQSQCNVSLINHTYLHQLK